MALCIYQIPAGPIETNAYLVADTVSGDAMLVDTPPDVATKAAQIATEAGATIRCIVITHGHWDHILGAAEVVAQWPVPIIGHELVRERLEKPELTVTSPYPMTAVKLDRAVAEGGTITVGAHTFLVMYMPGHDVAHILLYSEVDGVVLGGDVLFPDGHGRTDLPGSDQSTMNITLKRFLELPSETRVLPGHGQETTVGRESRWIRQIP